MILRRFTKHVSDQNWFAVGLDVLVVITGIFLGMQITEWNELRQEKNLEQKYIQRLHADMVGTLKDGNADLSWNSMRLQKSKQLLGALRMGVLEDGMRAEFDNALFYTGLLNPLRRRWSTVEELQTTGNLNILNSLELRNMIGAGDALFDRAKQIIIFQKEQAILLRVKISDKYGVIALDANEGEKLELAYDFEALSKDQSFINLVSHIDASSQMIIDFHQTYLEYIEKIRDKLAGLGGIKDDDPIAQKPTQSKADEGESN